MNIATALLLVFITICIGLWLAAVAIWMIVERHISGYNSTFHWVKATLGITFNPVDDYLRPWLNGGGLVPVNVLLDTDELSRRVYAYQQRYCECRALERTFMLREKGCKRAYVHQVDRRKNWRERMGIYNEQLNNTIILMKRDLKDGNGMS